MVDVSVETPAEAEVRLRLLMRRTLLTWLPGTWQFVDGAALEPDTDAIATVRNGSHLSHLRPAEPATGAERFSVFRVQFPPDKDNSGFVGWLASTIKTTTGSGVAIVCGHDAQHGGIYDYWLVPNEVAAKVRRLLERLIAPDVDTIDGRVMAVRETAPTARISSATVFAFDFDGTTVSSRYGGGRIKSGWLAGELDGERLRFRYLQVETDGTVDSGSSTATLTRTSDVGWQLVEAFEWATREGSGVNRLEEIDVFP